MRYKSPAFNVHLSYIFDTWRAIVKVDGQMAGISIDTGFKGSFNNIYSFASVNI